MKKIFQDLIDAAIDQGWFYARGGKHFYLGNETGLKIFMPGTPGDKHRGYYNVRATMRRYGIDV